MLYDIIPGVPVSEQVTQAQWRVNKPFRKLGICQRPRKIIKFHQTSAYHHPFTLVTMKIKYPGTNIIPTNLFLQSQLRIWRLSSVTFEMGHVTWHIPSLRLSWACTNTRHNLLWSHSPHRGQQGKYELSSIIWLSFMIIFELHATHSLNSWPWFLTKVHFFFKTGNVHSHSRIIRTCWKIVYHGLTLLVMVYSTEQLNITLSDCLIQQ